MKVYVIEVTTPFGEAHWIDGVFNTNELAQDRADKIEEENEDYHCVVEEFEVQS